MASSSAPRASTPRKSRNNNRDRGGGGSAANKNPPPAALNAVFEPDAATTPTATPLAHPPSNNLLTRTLPDLNLSVLRRHVPSIHSYVAISHTTFVYDFDLASSGWVESSFRGPLFVCPQVPEAGNDEAKPQACVFIMNRLGLENVYIDLRRVFNLELSGDFVTFSIMREDGEVEIRGVVLADEELDVVWAALNELWNAVRVAEAPEM